MEILQIEKPLAESDYKHDIFYIKLKDLMTDTIKLTFLPEYAIITGGYTVLIQLGKNINSYMRLAELVAKSQDNDNYHYFKTKIIENYVRKEYDSEQTRKNVEEFIKICYQESIIKEYKIYKDLTTEEWDKFFVTLPFNYKNQYFLLSQIWKYTHEHFIDDDTKLPGLLAFSEVNYDRYRNIFNLLQTFYSKTITKEAIMDYYAELEKELEV